MLAPVRSRLEATYIYTQDVVAELTAHVFAAITEFLTSGSSTYIWRVVSRTVCPDPPSGLVYPIMITAGNRIPPCLNQIPCLSPATITYGYSSLYLLKQKYQKYNHAYTECKTHK